jgi:hypothetical protein
MSKHVGVFALSEDDEGHTNLAIHVTEWRGGGPHGTHLTLEIPPEEYLRIELHPDPSVARFQMTGLFAL